MTPQGGEKKIFSQAPERMDSLPIHGTDEAAHRLGISIGSVHRLIREGKLPAMQLMPWAPWKVPVEALESEAVRIGVREVIARRPGYFKKLQCVKMLRLPGSSNGGAQCHMIAPFRPEDHDHPGVDVDAEFQQRRRSKRIVAAAKIHRPGHQYDARRMVREHHGVGLRPGATATISSTGLSPGRRTTTPPASIVTDADGTGETSSPIVSGGSGGASSITTGTTVGGAATPGKEPSSPLIVWPRQRLRATRLTPRRAATEAVKASGAKLSDTIRIFSARDQRRCVG